MLTANNIVTVILPGRYHGFQGQIITLQNDNHPDGPIAVKFPSTYRHLFDWEQKDLRTARFVESDLRLDQDWTEKNYTAYILDTDFGRRMKPWAGFYFKTQPLDAESLCEYGDCLCRAVARIAVNIWGIGHQYDVCAEHERFRGCAMEEWSAKSKAQKSAANCA